MGVGQHFGLDDIVAKRVVTIPAQRRRERKCVAGSEMNFRLRAACRVFRGKADAIIAIFGQRAGDNARLRIQRQAGRQMFRGKSHWPRATHGKGVFQRRAGVAADDQCAVKFRSRAKLHRCDNLLFARSQRGIGGGGHRCAGGEQNKKVGGEQPGKSRFHS